MCGASKPRHPTYGCTPDQTQKPLASDGASQLGLRSGSADRLGNALMPAVEALEYADRF